jgi:hypothetical protein
MDRLQIEMEKEKVMICLPLTPVKAGEVKIL